VSIQDKQVTPKQDLQVLIENINLHKSEAYFYQIQHPEIYNLKEQKRLRNMLSALTSDLQNDVLCVDIGGGVGNISNHLKRLKKEIVACDLSRDMLENNRTATHRIVCDAENLPLRDDVSSLTTTYSFFHHVPDYQRVINEICRIAKIKGSKIYFDHDNFADKKVFDVEKLSDKRRLLSYLVWSLTSPRMLVKLSQYLLYGKRRHKKYLENIDFTLTDQNKFSPQRIMEMLCQNKIQAKILRYRTGSCLLGSRYENQKTCDLNV